MICGREFLAAFALAGILGVPGLARSQEPAGEVAGPSLLRTTFIVADIERAVAFYAVLGFRTESELSGDRFADSPFPLNVRAERYRLVILASPRAGSGRIGLIVFENQSPKPVRPPRERVGLGDAVLVIDVADAVAVYEQLTRAGIRTVETPQTFESRTRAPDGRPMRGRVFHVFDPDGNLIEILEAPKPSS
jgi:catechol 2,3-dioxygenase-like lactoylglutathione lyase family enzyme